MHSIASNWREYISMQHWLCVTGRSMLLAGRDDLKHNYNEEVASHSADTCNTVRIKGSEQLLQHIIRTRLLRVREIVGLWRLYIRGIPWVFKPRDRRRRALYWHTSLGTMYTWVSGFHFCGFLVEGIAESWVQVSQLNSIGVCRSSWTLLPLSILLQSEVSSVPPISVRLRSAQLHF